MKNNLTFPIRLFLLGCVIPVIMSTVVYVGFFTNYTAEILFSKQGFEHYYNNGIYKYRVLGQIILLKTYDLIRHYDLPTLEARSLPLLKDNGDPEFYSAYFYVNTVFLCLTCMLLLIILAGGTKSANFLLVDFPVLFMCFLMAITQYVVVPYDTLSYFFLALAVILIMYGNKAWHVSTLGIVVVLATLTRETAIFILAFYAAIHYRDVFAKLANRKINRQQVMLLLLIVCFLGTYVGLRLVFGKEQAVYQAFLLTRNINLSVSLFGILFYISIALLVLITTHVTKEISVFFLVTLPYVGLMWLIADPWEIRLWTPLIMLLIIMKVQAHQSAGKQDTVFEVSH